MTPARPGGGTRGPDLRGALLAAGLALSLAALAAAGWRVGRDRAEAAQVAALAAGEDVAVADDAAPAVLAARARALMRRGRLEEAQALLAPVEARGTPAQAGALHHDLANARLRAAIVHLEGGRVDPGTALVRLSKDGYRRALALDPGLWDARHNLDVAMRLVRDFPEVAREGEALPPEAAKRLWTDLPGQPRGLP